MPSFYTQKLYYGKEQSFQEFVLNCSRAMGAFLHMRDHSSEGKPTFKESLFEIYFHKERIQEIEAERDEFLSKTEQELAAQYEEEKLSFYEDLKKRSKKNKERIARYEKRIAEVNAWKPPTDEHKNLKMFMLDQLNESNDFDTHEIEFYQRQFPLPEEWREKETKRFLKDLDYHMANLQREIKRREGCLNWYNQLLDSLGLSPHSEDSEQLDKPQKEKHK